MGRIQFLSCLQDPTQPGSCKSILLSHFISPSTLELSAEKKVKLSSKPKCHMEKWFIWEKWVPPSPTTWALFPESTQRQERTSPTCFSQSYVFVEDNKQINVKEETANATYWGEWRKPWVCVYCWCESAMLRIKASPMRNAFLWSER